MPDWREEYLASVKDAESRNGVSLELIEACSQLTLRLNAVEAENRLLKATQGQNVASVGRDEGKDAPSEEVNDDSAQSVAQLRLDLAEAIRSKSSLEARLSATSTQRDQLRQLHGSHTSEIVSLTAERNTLRAKVRDKEEELRGKSKMLGDMQDEALTLEMQLNLAEQKRDQVGRENKQLLERFMRRVGQEADQMNLDNET